MKIFNLEILTIQECNMKCDYCFEGDELQNKKTQNHKDKILHYINVLLDSKYFKKTFDGICLNYWGGEPTLNYKLIEEIVLKYANDERVNHFMYTNGTLLKRIDKLLNIDIKGSFKFQISYDGPYSQRKDNKGHTDNTLVKENIFKLLEDHQVQVKSTLTFDNFLIHLDEIWDHFNELHSLNNSIRYSPTLEYTQEYLINDNTINQLRKMFAIISKKELDFYNKYGYHLFSWFGNKELSKCSAGANIQCIDFDGNINICHGSLYSPNKKDMIFYNILNLNDEQLIQNFINIRESFIKNFNTYENNLNEECKTCISTTCYSCPVVNFDRNKDEDMTVYEKIYTSNVPLCTIYRECGLYIKAIQKRINDGIN